MTTTNQQWSNGVSVEQQYTTQQTTNQTQTPQSGQSQSVPSANSAPNNGSTAKTTTNILSAMPNMQNGGDKNIPILMALNNPRIIQFGELLTSQECDELIELSQSRLKPSTVVNPVNGNYDYDPTRSSQGCFFKRGEFELIQRIENRISHLLNVPVTRGEPISVLNYMPGEEYQPHWDYFDPKNPGNARSLNQGGQRYATLIMYLNDVEAGGSTIFPKVGLNVLPRKGHAVFFAYADHAGNLDELSLHGGSPVEKGEKWIATKWLRLNEF
ncbi:2OG-Fe(II) oxygenase [Aliikangiella maris]|uniref:2OG-Fe(II) oxygenase n=2 Tax=Aliikangiella maris TaxID=3162458 RepID=A0ABV3MJZ5_9GAMM